MTERLPDPVFYARLLSSLTAAIFKKYDEELSRLFMGRNMVEAMPVMNEMFAKRWDVEDLDAPEFMYVVCLAVGLRRGDLALTPKGQRHLKLPKLPDAKAKKPRKATKNGK